MVCQCPSVGTGRQQELLLDSPHDIFWRDDGALERASFSWEQCRSDNKLDRLNVIACEVSCEARREVVDPASTEPTERSPDRGRLAEGRDENLSSQRLGRKSIKIGAKSGLVSEHVESLT
jgi:hypothetical protein